MKAEDAKLIADESQDYLIKIIIKSIRHAAIMGLYQINHPLTDDQADFLTKLGYKVERMKSFSAEYKSSIHYIIWK